MSSLLGSILVILHLILSLANLPAIHWIRISIVDAKVINSDSDKCIQNKRKSTFSIFRMNNSDDFLPLLFLQAPNDF